VNFIHAQNRILQKMHFFLLCCCFFRGMITEAYFKEECDESSVFHGKWNVSSQQNPRFGFSMYCPQTFLDIDRTYQGLYFCSGDRALKKAVFHPSCSVVNSSHSIQYLASRNHSLLFVGDSTMNIFYNAFRCMLEHSKKHWEPNRHSFIWDKFLNRNASLQSSRKEDAWEKAVKRSSARSISVVMNTGSWYNSLNSLGNIISSHQ